MKKVLKVLLVPLCFTFLYLVPLVYSLNFGLGADPSVFNVTLGNNTGESNHVIYGVNVFNTGDIGIKVKMLPDQNLFNFSQPVQKEIEIEPNKTKEFFIKFDRNGTGNKIISGRIRLMAEPSDPIQSGMINIRPAVDLKITIKQLPMEKEKKNIPFWLIAILVFIGFMGIFYLLYILDYFINTKKKNKNMKKGLAFLITFCLLVSPVFATIGIGVSPASYTIDFNDGKNHDYRDIDVILTNNGNAPLFINGTSEDFNIELSDNEFEFPACSCLGYCQKEVVECDELFSPKKLTLRIYNPNLVEKEGWVIFRGSQVDGSDQMVMTGVNAKIRFTLQNLGHSVTTTTTSTTTSTTTTTQESDDTTTTTQQSSSGDGWSGTTTSTTIIQTTTTQESDTTTTTRPEEIPPEDLDNQDLTDLTDDKDGEPLKFSLIHFFLNTTGGFMTIVTVLIIITLSIIFYIQKKKSGTPDNPFLQDNQGLP